MKLYYSPGACSLSPHIVLEESGLPYQAVSAPTKTHKLEDGTDYYTINPLGYVPLLVLDDGTQLSEGPAIVQYIADQAPEKNLAPANGTLARYQRDLRSILVEFKVSNAPEAYAAIAQVAGVKASDVGEALRAGCGSSRGAAASRVCSPTTRRARMP